MFSKNLKIIFFILVVVFLASFTYKYILGGSITWKTYKNQEVSFEFKYPSTWAICEEFYPNLDLYFVHASDKPIDCKNVSFTKGSRHLSIEDTGESTSEKDVKTYLDKSATDAKKAKENTLPVTPGFTWSFKDYENNLLSLKEASVAEVQGLEGSTYVMLHRGHVFVLRVLFSTGLNNIPMRIILWTLQLPEKK